jgi:hypothetical protein
MSTITVDYLSCANTLVLNAVANVELRTPTTGTHTNVDNGLIKVWVTVDQPGIIQGNDASFNVSSLTDDGTGLNDTNIASTMDDNRYPNYGTILGASSSVNYSRYTFWSKTGNATTICRTETGYDYISGNSYWDGAYSLTINGNLG